MNIVSSIVNSLQDKFKDKVRLHSVSRDELVDLIKTNRDAHAAIAAALSALENQMLRDWANRVKSKLKKRSNDSASKAYDIYLTNLRGSAISAERSVPLSSLYKANKEYIGLLNEISKKIKTILENDTVELHNMRMSSFAVIGLLRNSSLVARFSTYLFSYLTKISADIASNIPGYITLYLTNNAALAAKYVSDILDKKGDYLFLREVNSMKANNRDFILGLNGATATHQFLGSGGIVSDILENVLNALRSLNIFTIALDKWDDYKLARYEKNKELKQWMEQHVSLLQMDLNNMDPTSPEYQRTVSIINAYDAKITEYDEKIIEFEQED